MFTIVVSLVFLSTISLTDGMKDGDYYYLKGDFERAIDAYNSTSGDEMTDEKQFRLALSYFNARRYKEARKIIDRWNGRDNLKRLFIILIDSKDGGIKDVTIPERLLDDAVSYTIAGMIMMDRDKEMALQYFDMAIARDSNYFFPWYYKGMIYESMEEFPLAIRYYRRAVEINPLFAQAHNNLGYCYKEMHFYTYAVVEYRKAIELMPDRAGYYYNLGNALTHLERIDEAYLAYKRALELDPTFAKAHYNLGRTYLRKDMVREAIEEFKLYLKYGNSSVFEEVAPEEAVEEEIEQLEIYLRQNE